MIRVKNLTYKYGEETALIDFSYEFEKGKCYTIEGPNGCGKSTLFRILNGLSFANEGEYWFSDTRITQKYLNDAKNAGEFHKHIGYLFQNCETMLFTRSVEDEVAFGLYQLGYEEDKVKEQTEKYLKLLDLEKIRKKAPFALSGGEKKRCALAAVLAMEPEVITMDEPLAGLDEDGQEWLLHFLSALKNENRTILIATHDKSLSESVADIRIIMDKNHRIISSGQ